MLSLTIKIDFDQVFVQNGAMEAGWKGLPFRPISELYQSKFGEKVYKIPVTVVDDCPNRRGLKGMETCIFCDVWGSAARAESFTMALPEQIETYQKQIGQRFNAKAFLVYFQAYTNTFTKVSALRENLETALKYDFVKGVVIGTRPDCLSKSVLDLWNEYSLRTQVFVEFGVQSFYDDQLEFMKRGHSRAQSIDAILKTARETTADLGLHLMFGLPGETDAKIIETAQICSDLPISNIKLHNLHVLANTPLADLYARGDFKPIERHEYAEKVALFLQHLAPHIKIHRLAALSSRWDELIAPAWTTDKMGTHQYIVDLMRTRGQYQSQLHDSSSAEQTVMQQELQIRSVPLQAGALARCESNLDSLRRNANSPKR
jgi:uncharacterized protein